VDRAGVPPATAAAQAAGRPLLLAHRGVHGGALGHAENSLPALLAAATTGCDGVEFDVRFSRGGVPVIIHDETLARTHGDERAVRDLDASELQRLGVPTLTDALAALPETLFLDLELKVPPLPGFFAALRERSLEIGGQLVISSFDEDALREVGLSAPEWSRWLNVESQSAEARARALALGVDGVSVEKSLLSSEWVADLQASGLELAVWTLRTREDLVYLSHPGLVAACVEGEAR
jgi:glycerophosphoryl diester phosphodiesterase